MNELAREHRMRDLPVVSAAEALGLVLRFEYPADAVLSRHFQTHRSLGPRERAFVAESVFGVLRHQRVLEHLVGQAAPRALVLAWLVRFGGGEIPPATGPAERAMLERVRASPIEHLPGAVVAELPDWVFERLTQQIGEPEVLAVGHALQEPAPLDLRVNTMRTDRESALAKLRVSGVDAAPTPYSPIGIRVTGRPALNQHPLFLEGALEVQDEGSQLVGMLLAPRRGNLVVDFCAGAGGKSLQIGAAMHSRGRVYAFDISPARLARMKPRLKRSGLSNLHPYLLRNEHDVKVKRLAGKIDRVLVDAPCSGLGTLRRNPDLKWRQSPGSVAEMTERQRSILDAAATLLNPQGRLVYATCSLLREENEQIVEAFAAARPDFRPVSCEEVLQGLGVGLRTGRQLRLWPHVHGTDGFFAACFERG